MTFDYWRDMYKPMTEKHYANGGYYIEQELTTDPITGRVYYRDLRRLSLLEALTWREPAGSNKCLNHVYKAA